jgi:hypothetical protein
MIRTRFAGRILEYPCTARPRGRWSAAIAPGGEVVEESFSLTLSLQFNFVNGVPTIWPLPRSQWESEPEGAQIGLRSLVESQSSGLLSEPISSSTFIGDIEELDLKLFHRPNFLYAVVKSEFENTGRFVYLACLWAGEGDPFRFFAQPEINDESLQCNGFWLWDGSVRIRWAPFSDKYLRRFSELYYLIKHEFNEMKIGEYEPNYELE